jgi:hypothetical protein
MADRKPEYNSWQDMIQRCHNAFSSGYQWTGGKGIIVCGRWRYDFNNFYADMGLRPTGKPHLMRIDKSKNYTPENSKWVDRLELNQKSGWCKLNMDLAEEIRMKSADGVSRCLLAKEYNVSKSTIHNVLNGLLWITE